MTTATVTVPIEFVFFAGLALLCIWIDTWITRRRVNQLLRILDPLSRADRDR